MLHVAYRRSQRVLSAFVLTHRAAGERNQCRSRTSVQQATQPTGKLYALIQYIDVGQNCATCLPVPVELLFLGGITVSSCESSPCLSVCNNIYFCGSTVELTG